MTYWKSREPINNNELIFLKKIQILHYALIFCAVVGFDSIFAGELKRQVQMNKKYSKMKYQSA
ncbi:MAG: hypothetical protein WB014_00050, partial [Methanosarcina sp.]